MYFTQSQNRANHTAQPAQSTQRTTTCAQKPSLLSRLTNRRTKNAHTTTTTRATRTSHNGHTHSATAAAPVHYYRRRPSLGDKVSGALLKLKGSITGKPGQKAAGTKRMWQLTKGILSEVASFASFSGVDRLAM